MEWNVPITPKEENKMQNVLSNELTQRLHLKENTNLGIGLIFFGSFFML
jgi:hypothetical protein